MENIHPNHNPLSKSLMLWSNTNANFRYYHISSIMHIYMWKQINNISRYCGNHDLISPDHGKHPSESSGTLLMHLSESRARKNNVLFHKLQAAGISVVTESVFGFTKLILHHPRAVTAASRGSTIADLALRITHQPEPYIRWSRFTHAQPCLTLISTVWALVCATAPPVQSPAKASAILNESVTAVTASRFSPVQIMPRNPKYDQFQSKGHHIEEKPQSMTKMARNHKFDPFNKVKIAPKLDKPTNCDHNLISSVTDHDPAACKISGHSLYAFSRKCLENPNLTCFTKSK